MKKLLILTLLSTPVAGFAHAGHGHVDPGSLMHWLLTPEHAIPALIFACVFSWMLFRRNRKATQRK
jgi:hypothetical protein